MRIDPPFPGDRCRDPMRRAELRIYRQLANSEAAGRALYEVRACRQDRELDFMVFMDGFPPFGIEVKGGSYRLRAGDWQLHTPDGWQWKPSPVTQLCEAADALACTIGQRVGRDCFIVPVLVFPDMKPDPDIEALSAVAGAQVMWGTSRFADRLLAQAGGLRVHDPPAAADIEVAAISPISEV